MNEPVNKGFLFDQKSALDFSFSRLLVLVTPSKEHLLLPFVNYPSECFAVLEYTSFFIEVKMALNIDMGLI